MLAVPVGVAEVVVSSEGFGLTMSANLVRIGASLLAGLVVAWVLRLRGGVFGLLSDLVAARLAASLIAVPLKVVAPGEWHGVVGLATDALYLLVAAVAILFHYGVHRTRTRRAAAVALVLVVNLAASTLASVDGVVWMLSAQLQPWLGRDRVAGPGELPAADIVQDRLWEAQPGLVAAQTEPLRPPLSGRTNVYSVGVAASGSQSLFSREAQEALRVAAEHFGADSRGVALLSNGPADLMRAPLATRGNLEAVVRAIGETADPKRDLTFVYLASHGSRTAELTTDLPDYQQLQPLSSATTAKALDAAGIRRRIVVVSACYAGTWIPALANDDTIVIAASAKDRTSFGCDDSRRLTVFGEAFLGALASKEGSLRGAFEAARRKIGAWEREAGQTPSLPQAFVGRNMIGVWAGEPPRREALHAESRT